MLAGSAQVGQPPGFANQLATLGRAPEHGAEREIDATQAFIRPRRTRVDRQRLCQGQRHARCGASTVRRPNGRRTWRLRAATGRLSAARGRARRACNRVSATRGCAGRASRTRGSGNAGDSRGTGGQWHHGHAQRLRAALPKRSVVWFCALQRAVSKVRVPLPGAGRLCGKRNLQRRDWLVSAWLGSAVTR